MKITKLGHCCLLIEEKSLRILTDPGSFSTLQDSIKNIDIILITHEHQDHFHIPSVKTVLKNNPKARIMTNTAVGLLLEKEGIKYEILEEGQNKTQEGVLIEGFGTIHAEVYETIPRVQNTGYFISNRLYYPGDALHIPPKLPEILALPVAGPWLKISESFDFALACKPKIIFPVHDGGLKNTEITDRLSKIAFSPRKIFFQEMELGKTIDFDKI
ncbi:MAG: MBL fold metallo-hydrolase [Candidatus Pacebacteria bacterium]|nr:MBL fold metallo-hydrolase [Candidatus Paceibacterota bacterium]MDD5357195.1 MBL fold metallo-hydrolase [Candidatus Paceibacterota bacterium]